MHDTVHTLRARSVQLQPFQRYEKVQKLNVDHLTPTSTPCNLLLHISGLQPLICVQNVKYLPSAVPEICRVTWHRSRPPMTYRCTVLVRAPSHLHRVPKNVPLLMLRFVHPLSGNSASNLIALYPFDRCKLLINIFFSSLNVIVYKYCSDVWMT